jgi:hypothetical protein
MTTTQHTIQLTLNLAEGETITPEPVVIHGQPYELTNEMALSLFLPEGTAPTKLDFTSVPGFIRFGAVMVPADRFRSLTATVVAASRPPTPEEPFEGF